MKRIEIGRFAGFCSGVERTIRMTMEALNKDKNRVYSLGQIIHNPQMVRRLEELGLNVVSDINEIKEGIFIVRSHGLPDNYIRELKKRGLKIIDATCPFVKKVQEKARVLKKQGYELIIVGDSQHPEIKGVLSAVSEKATVISTKDEAELVSGKRVGVVFQTTFPLSWAQDIVAGLLDGCQELKVYNTLCFETLNRQKEAIEMARVVDVMIVVGGKNSANTTNLAKITASCGCPTYHIEEARELQSEWFDGVCSVGLTAGASTQSLLIDEVVSNLKQILGDAEVHIFGVDLQK